MAQIRVMADAVDARGRGERRVHDDGGGPDVVKPVGDGFRIEGGDDRLGKEPGQEAGAGLGVFVEMQMARGVLAEGALRHDRQHAGAGAWFQDGVARPDGGGLERGIGQGQRRRELLQADLLVRALRMRRFERGDGVEHRQHGAGAVRSCPGLLAHRPAVALHEQHDGGFGGLVGVLPHPGAQSVGCAEGPGHRIPEGRGGERPAGLKGGQQGLGGSKQGVARGRTGRRYGRVDGEIRKGRTRVRVRRRAGVEHGMLRAGRWEAGRRREAGLAPGPAGPPPACWPASCRRRARKWESAFGEVQAGSGGADQPNRLPSALKVHSFTATISSTVSSEVWCSYSERSWR